MRKEKMKKGVKFGLGIAAVGVGIVGYGCFEYYVLGGDLI